MGEAEFDRLFNEYWKLEYPLVRKPAKDALHAADELIEDVNERVRVKLFLLEYARQVQECSLSRIKNNKARRLFEVLGIDPLTLELDNSSL